MPSSKHRHRQRKQRAFHPPPLFWDKLPRLWLTKSSLREANRRNRLASSSQDSSPCPRTFAPDFLRPCSPTRLQEIRKHSRGGGPDLSDIRNTLRPNRKNTTVYDRHFEEHIMDHGVYLPLSAYPDGIEPPKPENFKEIHRILRTPRPSHALSPDALEKKYEEFVRLSKKAADELLVIKNILPILEGKQKGRELCILSSNL